MPARSAKPKTKGFGKSKKHPERETVLNILIRKMDNNQAVEYEKGLYELSAGDMTEYKTLAYEKLGQLIDCNLEARKAVLEDIKEGLVGWDSSFYTKQKSTYERNMDRSVQKPSATKGLYKCKNITPDGKQCVSDEFYTWSQQTRSGDEGMTHFRECAKCGKRGRI
jgi:DNA-directed RNA polymerase subunit M/transcription elongation factor TFIIS